MNHHKLIIQVLLLIFTFAFNNTTFAKTLREMAIQSSIILAASESDSVAKKCNLNHDQVSKLSQKLKSEVDEKIQKLTDGDLKIVAARASTCEGDCTCSIYGLALQERGIKNPTLERLAATETATDRLHCLKKIKNYCKLIK